MRNLILLLAILFAGVAAASAQNADTHPQSAGEAEFKSGSAKQAKGDWAGAIADYTKAITLKPDMAIAYRNRGMAKFHKGDTDGALADYDKAVALKPDDAGSYLNRGAAKEVKFDWAAAIADYSRAIALKPNLAIAYRNRGLAKVRMRIGSVDAHWADRDGAIADLTKAISFDPRNVGYYCDRAEARHSRGDLEGTKADYGLVLAINPRCVQAYVKRAEILSQEDNNESHVKAVWEYTRAIELEPTNALYYAARGGVKKNLQPPDKAGANADFAMSLKLNPNNYALRAEMDLDRGDKAAAKIDTLKSKPPHPPKIPQ